MLAMDSSVFFMYVKYEKKYMDLKARAASGDPDSGKSWEEIERDRQSQENQEILLRAAQEIEAKGL